MKLIRILGWTVQALVLGTLVFIAIANLVGLSTGSRIFDYQGF